jgi:hypothetical protein
MTAIRNLSWSPAALLGAAGAGVAAGGLTAYLQGVLPASWNTVANSGAVWTLVAALVAGLVGRRRATAAAAGLLVLVGEVVGYYAYVSDVGHLPVLRAEELLWTVAALWIGPAAGVAAFCVRWGPARERVCAVLAFCGVVGGEGVYLRSVAGVPAAGLVEVVAAAVGSAAALMTVRAPVRWRLLAAVVGAAVAAGVYLAYRQPLLA